MFPAVDEGWALPALLNCFVVDYVARLKTPGNAMSTFAVKQLPIHRPAQLRVAAPWAPEGALECCGLVWSSCAARQRICSLYQWISE